MTAPLATPPKKNAGRSAGNRPSNLPHGRWLEDFGRLSAAETRLLRDVANGFMWRPVKWDGKRPTKATAANRLRGGLIRFLLLGGDTNNPVHEQGVTIAGAWIEDVISLHQARATARLNLSSCHLQDTPILMASTLPELALRGCLVPGLSADRMIVQGGVFLEDGFEAIGPVRLLGVQIGGNLQCGGGKFHHNDTAEGAVGDALLADRMVVNGGVFLTDEFEAIGRVRLIGAQISGNLDCTGGTFRNVDSDGNAKGEALTADGVVVMGDIGFRRGFSAHGELRLLGASIGGDFVCLDGEFRNADADGKALGDAISMDRMTVKGSFFLLQIREMIGGVSLSEAQVGSLVDHDFEWPRDLTLDGFRYDSINGATDARSRIAWLNRQYSSHVGVDFRPQPWEQLIAVLRAMGHRAEASEIAIAKQNALRHARQVGVRQTKSFEGRRFRRLRQAIDRIWNPLSNTLTRAWHRTYGLLSGYGHKPQRVLLVTLGLVALSSLAYYEGRHDGLIGPTNPLVHMSAQTAHCGTGGDPGAVRWTDPACPVPPEYSTFQPFFFALDVTLPFVDLHQEADWGPLVTNKKGEILWGGRFLRWLMWFNIIFGWVASLMFVAIVSRLVEKD